MAWHLSPPPRAFTRQIARHLRDRFAFTAALLTLALAGFIGGYLVAKERSAALGIIDQGARTRGRVISKDVNPGSEDGAQYFVTYRFLVNDAPFERRGEVDYPDYSRMAVSSSVDVAYDPIIPGDSYLIVERNKQSRTGFIILALALGALFSAAGSVSAYGLVKLRKLWRDGEEITPERNPGAPATTEYFYAFRGRTIRIDDHAAIENLSVVRDNGKPVLLVDPSCPDRWQPLSCEFLPAGSYPSVLPPSRPFLPPVPRSDNCVWQKEVRTMWVLAGVAAGIGATIAWFAAPGLYEVASFRRSAIRTEGAVIERSARLVTYQARGLRNSFQISPAQMSLWQPGRQIPVLIRGDDMRTEAEVSIYAPLAAMIIAAVFAGLAVLAVVARARRRRTGEVLWRSGVETYAAVTSDMTYENVRMIQYRFVYRGETAAGRRRFAARIAPVVVEGSSAVVVLVNPENIRQNRLVLASEVLPPGQPEHQQD
ncbi:MAG TPA: DUF3592 domain-containing protein [Terriglobia bacterium]|nr:DUF3592 domain-containing protein [Terriglobia bacterium]